MQEQGRPVGMVVAARWQEDLSWGVRSPWPVRVVQKDVDTPNHGREAASYLWFMATQPIEADRIYAFVQGDPWYHGFTFEQLVRVNGYLPLGVHILTEDHEGAPNHPGLPLVRCLREWLGVDAPPPKFITRAGAQFLVPGWVILSRPRAWYAELQGIVSRHMEGPWIMERLWSFVWPHHQEGRAGGRPKPMLAPVLHRLPLPARREVPRLMPLLHGADVYAGFKSGFLDLQGWNGDAPIFAEVIAEAQPQLVVEVGTWKGLSAATMARLLPAGAQLLCVDTWLGALEFIDDERRHGWLACEHGYPTVYRTFLGNMVLLGLQDRVIPFPQTSLIAARWLVQHGIVVDVVYIDASHDEEDVLADMRAYWPLLRAGGIMFGDDYGPAWPGVALAVESFSREAGLEAELPGQFWLLRKP